MTTLIVINCQSDFITGTVSIKGAKNALEEIKNYIKKRSKNLAKIIFVIDWHPWNHSSFKEFGGDMQRHCVQYTPGACIEPKLLKLVHSLKIPYEVSRIGEIEEVTELGAFNDIDSVFDNFGNRYYLDEVTVRFSDADFVVCGVGNVVTRTLQNMINYFSPRVYLPGTIDVNVTNFIKDNGLEKETL